MLPFFIPISDMPIFYTSLVNFWKGLPILNITFGYTFL